MNKNKVVIAGTILLLIVCIGCKNDPNGKRETQAIRQDGSNLSLKSFKYEEVSKFTGVVQGEQNYGPPNYGENPETDEKVFSTILILKTKLYATPNHNGKSVLNEYPSYTVKELHLVNPLKTHTRRGCG